MNRYLCLSFSVLTMLSGTLAAQAPAPQAAPATTIKLNVVLSRYEGDKKLSSLPYTLSLLPRENGVLRTGTEVPTRIPRQLASELAGLTKSEFDQRSSNSPGTKFTLRNFKEFGASGA
jgi:hypothetical protein